MAAARQALIKRIYEDPRNGFGSIADTLRQARQQDPAITRGDVVQFMETVKTREGSPPKGLQLFCSNRTHAPAASGSRGHVCLFRKALPLHARGHRRLHKESRSRASGLQNGASCSRGVEFKFVKALGVPSYVYSDDGSEFKSEFKQKLDYFDVDKVVSRGHAYFVERAIRTLKEALPAEDLSGASGSEQVAPATARRPSAVQQQNSRRHGSRSQPSLLGSHESRTCQASHADAGQEKRSPSAVPGSG